MVYDKNDMRNKPKFDCSDSFNTITNVCSNEAVFDGTTTYIFGISIKVTKTFASPGYNYFTNSLLDCINGFT